MILCATDLDRTLIYSRAALGDDPPPVVPVERHDGKDASWMTERAACTFAVLNERALVVPVTTRTPEQWQRVRLPGPAPRYAVTANGGVLHVDGRVDHDWDATVAAEIAEVAPLAEIWTHVTRVCRPEWTVKLRNARGLFCYAVLHRRRIPPGFLAEAAGWAAQRGWQLSLQGRKLYWVPRTLTKSAAVAELARRSGVARVLAAGDSLLDADLLEHADRGIVARHGELVASGWRCASVRVTEQTGVLAGAEIVDWFSAQLG
ncbi:MAG TPA: HAD family hydrolase [Jatrophihabitans sp.]|nr:HAD family hydrolase [Jatrophihabitans sp.]